MLVKKKKKREVEEEEERRREKKKMRGTIVSTMVLVLRIAILSTYHIPRALQTSTISR